MITGPDPKLTPKCRTFLCTKIATIPSSHGGPTFCFSAGKPGRWEEVNDVYRNFLVHKPDTPFIENIEVRILALKTASRNCCAKIDWKRSQRLTL